MKVITTLSDIHYLSKGIALWESIKRHTEIDYRLYYLCLDQITYDTIKGIEDERLIPLYIEDEFKDNVGFELLKKNNKSNPNNFSHFHFALGSFFTNHIMKKVSPESVLYVDADILFYHPLEYIYKAMEGKSIGIVGHRNNNVGESAGKYNVGIIYFQGNVTGIRCLKWWKDVVLHPGNKWFTTHGTCGDQKYLELFAPLFGEENVKELDESIGHGAPWNFKEYRYYKSPRVIWWNCKKQLLIFNHFSRFEQTLENYKQNGTKEWDLQLEENPGIKRYYVEYDGILKDVKKRYEL